MRRLTRAEIEYGLKRLGLERMSDLRAYLREYRKYRIVSCCKLKSK